jgi:sorbitol-6-phosphate 2-dehydrogenase
MPNTWLGLEGRVVIVTGGASGIGKNISAELVRVGAKVAVSDLSVETGIDPVSGILNVACDVTNPASVSAMVAVVVGEFGHLDALVNNAGINLPRMLVDSTQECPEYELNERDFDLMFGVNVKGAYLATQAATKALLHNGGGTIVNITSEAGMEGSTGQSCYSATKSALNGFTRSWAKELGAQNIRVVGVAPGINEPTGLTSPAYNEALAYTRGIKPEQLTTDYSKVIPLGRPGKLSDIANLVVYLVSDRASYITGTTINISGGKSRG